MIYDPLSRSYALRQIKLERHSFTKPTNDREYIKLLRLISSEEYCPTSKIKENFPSKPTLTLGNLEAARYINHFRDGRYTFWKVTAKGYELLAATK